MPRVAVLCAIRGLGGAEISLLELVSRLRNSYEFHLVVPGDGLLKEQAACAGATVWVLPWPDVLAATGETAGRPGPARLLRAALSMRSFARQLSDLVGEIGAAALVTNSAKAHVVGALMRKPQGTKIIWYMRDGLEHRVLSRKLLALVARRCDLAICISQYVAGQFHRYVSASVPTDVVYNIVDLERFQPEAWRVKPADLQKNAGEIWFGMIGAITPLKGQDIFLDAAEKVLVQLPQARFVIVGDNPYATEAGSNYRQALARRAESSVLGGRAKFLGFRQDVPEILSLLDVLVQPNRGPEGLGRSVLEAMACGVPVVAVNQWGPAELIRDGETGLLFPPCNADELAARMLRLGKDASLRRSMGEHGRGWVQQNLVPNKLAGQFARILTNTIGPQLQEVIA